MEQTTKIVNGGIEISDELLDTFKADSAGFLPGGKAYAMTKAKGRHMSMAQKKMGITAGKQLDASALSLYTVVETTKIDGKYVRYDDIQDMDLADVFKLLEVFNALNFPTAAKSS